MQHRKYDDLTGRRFGKRTVQSFAGRKDNRIMWLCLCDCGKLSTVYGGNLRRGQCSSCISCGLRSNSRVRNNAGLADTPAYKMFIAAKGRAKKRKIPFDIELSDITVPAICPLLNIPLISGIGKGSGWSPNCPTLDRIIPSLGYVKGNVWVISGKANVIKSDASIEEIELLLKNWKGLLK